MHVGESRHLLRRLSQRRCSHPTSGFVGALWSQDRDRVWLSSAVRGPPVERVGQEHDQVADLVWSQLDLVWVLPSVGAGRDDQMLTRTRPHEMEPVPLLVIELDGIMVGLRHPTSFDNETTAPIRSERHPRPIRT